MWNIKFFVQFVNFLAILLCCDILNRIKEIAVDVSTCLPPNWFTFWLFLRKCFNASTDFTHLVKCHQLLYRIHFSSCLITWLKVVFAAQKNHNRSVRAIFFIQLVYVALALSNSYFPVCCKFWTILEQSAFSSSAMSCFT